MSKKNEEQNIIAKAAMKAPGALVGGLVTLTLGKTALDHSELGYPYQLAMAFGSVLLGQEVANSVNESIERYYCDKFQKEPA